MTGGAHTLLVAQSGGCTAAINASLAGVYAAASGSAGVERILGARFGVEGILTRHYSDLRRQPAQIWDRLRATPSAALGSCRRKLDSDDIDTILARCLELDARYLVYIGGNDSADTALRLHTAARHAGFELQVVAVPKTIDNDLPGTDHCPGYGSAARYIAQSTQDAGLDSEAMRLTDPIKIIEVMGRDAGWLAAASILGRGGETQAPHLICVPERALDVAAFVDRMAQVYARYGYAVAVVAETIRDTTGRPLGSLNDLQQRDAFGHPYISGAAQALTQAVSKALKVKARFDKPGTLQRMSMALSSTVDLDEAFAAGAEAVRLALAGQGGCMVGFERLSDSPYAIAMRAVPLQVVANGVRPLPQEYLGSDPFDVSEDFRRYVGPLVQPGLLPYARLRD